MIENVTPFALARFSQDDEPPALWVVIRDRAAPLSMIDPSYAPDVSLRTLLEDWPTHLGRIGAAAARAGDDGVDIATLTAYAPLPDPRQIFCTGANYRRHVVEMMVAMGSPPDTDGMGEDERRRFGEAFVAQQIAGSAPYIFMKPVTCVAGPNDVFELPEFSDRADWELELAAIISQTAFKVPYSAAAQVIAGYMIVNDLTARDKVRRQDAGAIGPDWLAAKGGPGFLPTGPLFVPASFVANPQKLTMELTVNGAVMQDDSTEDMTFDIPRQIEFLTSYVRLLPGDILCTGSPAGNGITRGIFLKDGDVMEAMIEGMGRQKVSCVAAVRA